MSAARALIALSGGVDSSVAAHLTVQAGYECAGGTMRLFDSEDTATITTASTICQHLGIPYYLFDFTEVFAEQVIDRFVADYERGWTPNPCINCNRFLKFDRLFEQVQNRGFYQVATGHYARREYDESTGRYLLKRALDRNKDQSYVLYSLTQAQLAHTLLPLGGLTKEQVREIAREQGLLNANKEESQDICFVPDNNYGAFLRRYTGQTYEAGDIVDARGRKLGTHQGIIDFTVGQRKGIGIAAPRPLYVTRIVPETATIIVGEEADLYQTRVVIEDVNLIACESLGMLDTPLRATAKHRYRSTEKSVMVTQIDEASCEVVFDEPQKAITCGQALVLYDDDLVIGGGTIAKVS